MLHRSLVGILTLSVLSGTPAVAQTLGTPVFTSPYRGFTHSEISGTFSDPSAPIGVAIQGEYRMPQGRVDVGFGAGYEGGQHGFPNRFLLGADVRAPLYAHTESFPLDVAGTLGIGGNFGSIFTAVRFPLGLSLGRRLGLEGSRTTFTPYVQPVLAPVFVSNGGGSNVDFTLGLGVNINFSPTFDVRVSGGIGDQDGVGIGLAYHR
jgi:hypothetical protein